MSAPAELEPRATRAPRMPRPALEVLRPLACAAWLLLATACASPSPPERARFPFEDLRGCVFSAPQVLAGAERDGLGEPPNAVVITIEPDSSHRAVADAFARARVQGLAVGAWLDLAEVGAGAPADARAPAGARESGRAEALAAARIARAEALLRDRPRADALFVAGWLGAPLACGCPSTICAAAPRGAPAAGRDDAAEAAQRGSLSDPARAPAAPDSGSPLGASRDSASELDPRAGARVLRGVRAFAAGAPVVPAGAPGACTEAGCAQAGCRELEQQAWSLAREATTVLALVLAERDLPPDDPLAAGAAIRAAARALPPVPPAPTGRRATVIAVLPALALAPDQLRRSAATARAMPRTGVLVAHTPLRR